MKKLFNLFLLLLICTAVSQAQNYEEEIGFTFVKAKYLLDTERYDDAVRELNRVINENPALEDALALRAEAKYRLSAFIGTKKDILKSIELKGITPDAVALLAKAEYQLTEFDAALNSLSTAIDLVQNDAELYEFRATIYMDRDQRLKACRDWESAADLGSVRAQLTAKRNCGYTPNQNKDIAEVDINTSDNTNNQPESSSTENKKENESEVVAPEKMPDDYYGANGNPEEANNDGRVVQTANEGEVAEDNAMGTDTSNMTPPEPKVDPRLLDESVNNVEIDEDLHLEISGQGLGSRDILKQPNILILSDEDGTVVIDICVSRGGRVISAAFDNKESTLKRKSLVSLALRKAKEFWFERSDLKEQCGEIVFSIKGS